MSSVLIWIKVARRIALYADRMEIVSTLRRYGLFDAKVPRYTSYPPANRFRSGVGARHQHEWLSAVNPAEPISVYVHIPFCRRLCWFCACRTQGTQTLRPVETYVQSLAHEIKAIARDGLSPGVKMARLHLGGGTPTLLSTELMNDLLSVVHAQFDQADAFEFSVEVDPTDASREVLSMLATWHMTRASIGVQDFDPKVQEAIGRTQSFETTKHVVGQLRAGGVTSLNIDVLYGLPHQTAQSLVDTLDQAVSLRPDRLALYGYAHVPHMAKRQVMIPDEALPGVEARFELSRIAKDRLTELGYVPVGIDHFALPHDSLTTASRNGTLSRNFQGYTDDPCSTLIGFGASAISKFPQGYTQNAVATSAYAERVDAYGFAAHKGIVLTRQDQFIAALIDAIMCRGRIEVTQTQARFPECRNDLIRSVDGMMAAFPDLCVLTEQGIAIKDEFAVAARLIAAHLDQDARASHIHSLAV